MVRPHDLVVSLTEVDRDDTLFVGGKGANLGEMISAGFPVPPGFVITANAYFEFLKANNLEKKIENLLATVNYEHEESLHKVSQHIKREIISGKVPENLIAKIYDLYENLGEDVSVAIRSSATSEDSKEASFAGQNETFLNIAGEANVIETVRRAWASLFDARSIYYRHEKKISNLKTAIALVVQKMVESKSSGVMFTVDPVTSDKSKIVIEAIFGLGEYIVQGTVTPDHYEVDKKTFTIMNKTVNDQDVMLARIKGENKKTSISAPTGKLQKIDDEDIVALAKIGERIEKHYYFPQDIEWAKEDSKLYIVQTRPITTLQAKKEEIKSAGSETIPASKGKPEHPILLGDPASPGIGVGTVCILRSPRNIDKLKKGNVLVTTMTNPDYVPAMRRASAIVTERGGRTSHAAIVAREFGIPAVVGTPKAMEVLHDGLAITVNGSTGQIFKGAYYSMVKPVEDKYSKIKTATKLYVNIAEPELADTVAARNVDGVGLLRAEFMIAQIGIHPKKLIHDGKSKFFIDKLALDIATICKAFYPRSVIYRATDFKSNEYASLTGGKKYEPVESNPMLGYRGAFRYVHDAQVFKLELAAIKRVREKEGLNNLNLMIPFVRTISELESVKKIISGEGLRRSHTFKLFMMVEIPSNVILIEDFIAAGIDGVSIGSNDLTMLILGTDRDNEEVAPEFDERDPAVLWALERVITACRKKGIMVSICGQAPSVYPSLVENLVSWGINSISVSPDAIDNTRRIIYLAEEKVVTKR